MRSLLVTSLAALALAACSSEPAQESERGDSQAPMPVEPDGGIGDGAGPPGDAAAISAGQIPARFRGMWDYEGGSCDPASDLKMEISGDEVLFYESIGRVSRAKPDGDDIIVTLEMEGEGETWQQVTRLSLAGSGESLRLHTSDGDKPKAKDDYPSKRCLT